LAEQETFRLLPAGGAIAFGGAVALVALLGRRRVPAGLAEGAFAAALSGAAILSLLVIDARHSLAQPALGHVLTALTVFWYALSRIRTRRQPFASSDGQNAAADEIAREPSRLWAYAALVCGLAVLVANLVTPERLTTAAWSAGATDLAALLALSVLAWVSHASPSAAYPLTTLLVCLFVLLVPSQGLEAHANLAGVAMNGISLLVLVMVVGVALLRWWRRRRLWLQDPHHLVELSPPSSTLFVSLVGVSLLVGMAGVLLREAAFTPTAVLLAALTCLTIGHLRTWLAVGEIGLILVAVGIVTASMAWLVPGWSGALFGLGLSGMYLLWLARFWDQQLNDGVPWTTAGRLIPIARRLAYGACAGAAGLAGGSFGAGEFQLQPLWLSAVTLVLLLGTMSLLVRDSYEHRWPEAAFAACLVTAAATIPGCRLLLAIVGTPVSPVIALAVGVLLLALRVAVAPRTPPAAAVYNACIGGVLPVIVLFTLILRGLDGQTAAALVLAAGAGGVTFRSFRASPRAPSAEHAGHT
jgi:hypothetical protein